MEALRCPSCGAPIAPNTPQCPYCGTTLVWPSETRAPVRASAPPPNVPTTPAAPPAAQRALGWSGRGFLAAGAGVAFALYVTGWTQENLRYWLDDTALTIWLGVLPAWLCAFALLWRTRVRAAYLGVPLFAGVFGAHLALIRVLGGRPLWDDHVGIALMVAGAVTAGWLLGRWLRYKMFV